MFKNRLPVVVALALVAVAVFAFAGLPLNGTSNVSAQYAPSAETLCGGTILYQVRLYGDTQAFADSGLTQRAVVLRALTPDKVRAKFLVCTNTLSGSAWRIYVSNGTVWIPANSGEVVLRYLRDNQP
jgi:hypothetical protein